MSQPPNGSSGNSADDGGWNSSGIPRYGSGGDDADLGAYNSEWGTGASGAAGGASAAGSNPSDPVRRPWTEEWTDSGAASGAANEWPTDPGNASASPETMAFAAQSEPMPAAGAQAWSGADWQQWEHWEQPAEPKRGKGVLIALSILLVLVLAAGGGYLGWRQFGGGDSASSTAGITKCAQAPEFEPTAFRDTADNGLDITFQVTPACNSRDFIDGSDVTLTVSEIVGSEKKKVAEAPFDLSANPLVIEQEGTEVNFEFPADGTFRSASDLGRGAEYEVEVSDAGGTAPGQESDEEDAEDTDGAGGSEATATSSTRTSASPTSSSKPAGCTPSSAADDLQDRRSSDRSKVSDDLVGKWVPQISSKQVGLVAEGKTWDECDILEEVEANSDRYPNVRLVWTSDWASFDLEAWWVTVVGLPYDSPETALAWCDNHGLDRDHCYAKKITTSGGTSGTTRR